MLQFAKLEKWNKTWKREKLTICFASRPREKYKNVWCSRNNAAVERETTKGEKKKKSEIGGDDAERPDESFGG